MAENNDLMEALNRLLRTQNAKPNSDLHATTFARNDSENIQEWIENCNRFAAHNVWDGRKQVEVIPLYLKKAGLTHYRS